MGRNKKVYQMKQKEKVTAEGTVEQIAKKSGKTKRQITRLIYKTRHNILPLTDCVYPVGEYANVYAFYKNDEMLAKGTITEIANKVFLSEQAIKEYKGSPRLRDMGQELRRIEEEEA